MQALRIANPIFYPVLSVPRREEWLGVEVVHHAVLLVGYDAKRG